MSKPKHTPGHALKLIRAYFRDCAMQEEAAERAAGRPPLSKSFAGYLALCDEAKPLADAAPELLEACKSLCVALKNYGDALAEGSVPLALCGAVNEAGHSAEAAIAKAEARDE